MLHLAHILEATTGGTRRHLRDVATGLDPRRVRQTLIVSDLRDPGFRDDLAIFQAQGIATEVVPMRRAPSPAADPAAAAALVRLLRHLAPDVVHTHSSKAGLLGRWAATRASVPRRIHTPHVFAFEMCANPALRSLYWLCEWIAAHWTDVLVCVSEAEARSAARLGRACPPVRIIRNGVAPPPERSAPRFDTPARFALVGRLCPQKGQDLLARTLLENPRLTKLARFELLGVRADEPLPPVVRKAAELGLCSLHPPLPPTRMEQYLDTLDGVLMPSRWEGMPYTLLEAMAGGRAVVAAAVGGVPEALRDRREGLLVPPADPRALVDAIETLCNSPSDARLYAAAAHRRVTEAYRIEHMLNALAALYEGSR